MSGESSGTVSSILPKTLRELLRRDVALELSRQRISSSLSEVEVETVNLQKTRPPFLFLHSKSTRASYNHQVLSASESLTALSQGLEKLERLRPLLHAWVEDELEAHLRASHPAYVKGLASHRFPEDWQRLSRRFNMRVQRFVEYVQNLRGAITGLAPDTVIGEDPVVLDRLDRTAKVGAAVDAEVAFLNRLADVQRRASDMGTETLRRQPPSCCEDSVRELKTFKAETAGRLIAEFTVEFQTQARQVTAAILSEAALAVADGPRAANGYVFPQWESLRKLVRLELDPERIQDLVADTEKLLGSHV